MTHFKEVHTVENFPENSINSKKFPLSIFATVTYLVVEAAAVSSSDLSVLHFLRVRTKGPLYLY